MTSESVGAILVVDDEPQMQLALRTALSRGGYDVEVASNGRRALEILDGERSFDLVLSDQRMPEMGGQELLAALQTRETRPPFIMITAHGTIDDAVKAMQMGAVDFITKPFTADELLRTVERSLNPERRAYREQASRVKLERPIVTNDPQMIRTLEIAEAVAKSDATVLIQGESGTGKELIARMLHASSPRRRQPFVAVNCAALPATLLESELFGHEKGAFTGAQNRKIGKFELAHGGTILLDEISEMELALQAKLLRVLQEREVDRVGGKDPISIDVRVLATTNRNLELMVAENRFRADLFYRLNVIPLTLPSLRERRGDIRLLVEHFMNKFLGKDAPALTPSVIARFMEYPWPGNIRELQNAVERAAILSRGREPQEGDFLLTSSARTPFSPPATAPEIDRTPPPPRLAERSEPQPDSSQESEASRVIRSGVTVHDMERELILETLRSTGYNRTRSATLLGISIRTLRNKLHEYRAAGIDIGNDDDPLRGGDETEARL